MELIAPGSFSKACPLARLFWAGGAHPVPAVADDPGCVPLARFSGSQVISYRIENFSGQFPPATERAIIAAAFRTWSNILDTRFQEVSSGEQFSSRSAGSVSATIGR